MTNSHAQPAEIGEMIGAYRLDGLIARGGMGCVYAATHAKLGRRAAVKVLVDELASNAQYVERFFEEARVVNEVRHPNIVDIFDFVETENPRRVAFVMELLDGPPLSALVRGRRLSAVQATHVALGVTAALEAVHAIGVVHRDLKPDNIVVLHGFDERIPDAPRIKLLDFGIAKTLHATATRTAPGAIIGTPAYAAPEQISSGDATPASDVYALGVILYEMLSGRRMFEGDVSSILRHKLIGLGVEIDLPLDLPLRDAFATLIGACIANEPERRLTLREVRMSLDAIRGGLTRKAARDRRRKTSTAHAMPAPAAPLPGYRAAAPAAFSGLAVGARLPTPTRSSVSSIQSLEAALVRRPRLAMSLGVAFIAAATVIIATATSAHSDAPVIIEPLASAEVATVEPVAPPAPTVEPVEFEEHESIAASAVVPKKHVAVEVADTDAEEDEELELFELEFDHQPEPPAETVLEADELPRW